MFRAIQRVISGENIQHQEVDQEHDQSHQQHHHHGGEEQGQNIIGNGGGGGGPPNTQSIRTTTSNNSPIDMVVDSPRRSGGSSSSPHAAAIFSGGEGLVPALVEDNDDDDMMDVDRDYNHDEDGDDHMGGGGGGGGGGLRAAGAGSNSPMQEVTHVEGTDNSTTGSSISDVSTQHEINAAHHHHDGLLQSQSKPEVIMAPAPPGAVPLPPRPSSSTSKNAAVAAAGSAGGTHAPPPQNTPPRMHHHQNNHFRDGDSRASSQNSSRDWGWFDDVNTTGSLGSLTALDNKNKQQGSRGEPASLPEGGGPPSQQAATTGGRDASSSTNQEHQQGQHSPSPQSTGDQNQHQDQKQSSPSSSERATGHGSGNPPTGVVRTPTAGNRGLGLLPNIGLMMESPNHSSSGNADQDDDYYFNPDSQEMLEPIIIPGISPRDMEDEAAVQAVTAPNYVLEESLSSQKLWKDTAGNRPPQPLEERAFFEKMWAQNFARSQVEYKMPVEVLTATTPISLSPFADGNFDDAAHSHPPEAMSNYNLGVHSTGDGYSTGPGGSTAGGTDVAEQTLVSRLNDPRGQHHVNAPLFAAGIMSGAEPYETVNRKVKGSGTDGDEMTVLIKGDNVFGTTVSKSFARPGASNGLIAGVDTVNISVASYRVVDSTKHGKYAQFLVIYREGSIRDTIGVWKRYSDFQDLAKKVTKAHEGCAAVIANISPLAVTEEHDVEHLPNAITSWRLLKKRQRWYRCLDAGYLSLKVFLLERFLHDILFESSTPTLLREFVGVPPPRRSYRS
mmetsp:Transcript_22425/g.52920  ORF Transcript_22425/g.52920 Transcript_22425/m.52920 type:complete len:782 (+) Transcript_22425:356-2701(+)